MFHPHTSEEAFFLALHTHPSSSFPSFEPNCGWFSNVSQLKNQGGGGKPLLLCLHCSQVEDTTTSSSTLSAPSATDFFLFLCALAPSSIPFCLTPVMPWPAFEEGRAPFMREEVRYAFGKIIPAASASVRRRRGARARGFIEKAAPAPGRVCDRSALKRQPGLFFSTKATSIGRRFVGYFVG